MRSQCWGRRLALFTAVLLGLIGGSGASPVSAQGFDPTKTPATTVPADRWGDLESVKILGDLTSWNFGSTPGPTHTFWHDLDIENGWLFASTGRGLQVWDVRTPATPDKKGYFFGSTSSFSAPFVWTQNDSKFYFLGLDAPPGVDSVVAVATSFASNGLLIFDTRDKTTPRLLYQDQAREGIQVWSTTIGGTHYAFYPSSTSGSAGPAGVLVYNLSAALGLSQGCSENGGVDEGTCRDGQGRSVFAGRIASNALYVHGTGNLLALGRGSAGVQIWSVSNPSQPSLLLSAAPAGVAFSGVALWQEGASTYLASVSAANLLRVYDVSCVASGPCSLGNPISTTSLPVPSGVFMSFLSLSRAAAKPMIYVGGEDQFTGGPQREFLFDMSDPSAPREVTPQTHPAGYWGWFYFGNPTGFNWVMPRSAKFNDAYLYRAAFSVLDQHRLTTTSPPVANFSWSPSPIYRGFPVVFTDTSTGSPTSRTWTFQDASPGTSGLSPVSVTFSSTGSKQVTLTPANAAGPGAQKTVFVDVLDPAPAIASVTAQPNPALQCQPITWTANGLTGFPQPTVAWTIKNGASVTQATGAGTSFVWTTGSATSPGPYTGEAVAQNTSGSTSPVVGSVTVNALAALPGAGAFTPTNDPFSSTTVQFHVVAAGATEWNWDFGNGPAGWTNDPVSGPNPSFTYTQQNLPASCNGTVPCSFPVRVSVRNCLTTTEVQSAALTLTIQQLIPLHAEFKPTCPLGSCLFFSVGDAVSFTDQSTGAQFWDYDWDGNGSFEDPNNGAPKLSHQYNSAGSFQPRLQVRRGTESNVFQTVETIRVSSVTQPASISVFGPSSGNLGATLTYSASASNCTPASSGWNWSVAGATVQGASNTSTITLSWSTAGTKSVSATNSGCSGAFGSQTVTISGGSGGSLAANFTFAPVLPQAGSPVAFDASTSTGSPESYLWQFGDSTPNASGSTTSHAFAAAGTYSVRLTVSKVSSACPPAPFCEATVVKQVVVLGEPPVGAAFTSDKCTVSLGFYECGAATGELVSFTDQSTGAVASRSWNFGDGGTSTLQNPQHTFAAPGFFTVALTVTGPGSSSTISHVFNISGPPPPPPLRKVAVAWIAQTQRPLVQTSDLFVNNPSDAAMTVEIFFRKRGVPEANPPKQTRAIPARGTIYIADVLGAVFARPEQSGFIVVEVKEGTGLPIVTSFNTTFDANGNQFGQTLSGVPFRDSASEASTARTWHVVGLNDDLERDSYFGLSNAGAAAVSMKLRFYDRGGDLLGHGDSVNVPGYGQKQFSLNELRDDYGVGNRTDWRVEIEPQAEVPLIVYGANRRVATKDTSSLVAADGLQQRVYLLGAIDGLGLSNSLWQSELVMANPTGSAQRARVLFSEVGVQSAASLPVFFDLAARETRRVSDVITTAFGLSNKAGMLTIDSTSSSSPYLVVQGESFNNADPAKRFGQTLAPIYEADAATAGHSMNLVGLRQDAEYRAVLWIANVAATEIATMNVVYRDLSGNVLKRIAGFSLQPGRVKQFPPSTHPSVAGGRFTVGVEVLSGKVIAGAQVVNNKSNDPAYVKGQAN